MDALEIFARTLREAQGDWTSIQAVFSNHFKGGFVDDFIKQELGAVGNDLEHVVPNSVGPAAFTFINTSDFEYSIRIVPSFAGRAHPVKWLGMYQIIGIRGRGPVTIRKCKVPADVKVNSFRPAVCISHTDLISGSHNDLIASCHSHELLDVYAVSSPVVLEILTYRQREPGLCWTFDQDLRAIYAEESCLTVSRFRNVLELAHAAGKAVPDKVYDLALNASSAHVALLAIRSMLISGHAEAFVQLNRAIDSGSEELRQGAQVLFDSMMMSRGRTNAA
ncbi:MAG TPA: hypothetical protein VJ728_06345 [Candidatus Binataceae bacterium]|nr:hypothetical protein [Candidatus Binataceae bacterium]